MRVKSLEDLLTQIFLIVPHTDDKWFTFGFNTEFSSVIANNDVVSFIKAQIDLITTSFNNFFETANGKAAFLRFTFEIILA